jgi:hypothetical protein
MAMGYGLWGRHHHRRWRADWFCVMEVGAAVSQLSQGRRRRCRNGGVERCHGLQGLAR